LLLITLHWQSCVYFQIFQFVRLGHNWTRSLNIAAKLKTLLYSYCFKQACYSRFWRNDSFLLFYTETSNSLLVHFQMCIKVRGLISDYIFAVCADMWVIITSLTSGGRTWEQFLPTFCSPTLALGIQNASEVSKVCKIQSKKIQTQWHTEISFCWCNILVKHPTHASMQTHTYLHGCMHLNLLSLSLSHTHTRARTHAHTHAHTHTQRVSISSHAWILKFLFSRAMEATSSFHMWQITACKQ
jgi:hypothetical protein